MNETVCQSCGMPMAAKEDFGTNKDESINTDYCIYCFKDGNFTCDSTMDQMIEACAGYPEALKDEKGNSIPKEEYIARMEMYFPTLKRWKNN